jgi:hypothetical protein
MSTEIKRQSITPYMRSDEEYKEEFWSHLKTHEGVIGRIYSDPLGIPTMGAGVALAVKGKGANAEYKLLDREKIGTDITGDPQNPYRFSEPEWKRLEGVVGILNNPHLLLREKAAQASELIPAYKSPKEPDSNNKFDFTLSEERIKDQALAKVPYYQERALETVREEATKRGWSSEETEAYIKQFKGSQEEMALTSLQYGGVKSPKASAALLDGDKAAMRNEIYYRSNANKLPGLATRRRVEAEMATGDPSGWSKEEQAKWEVIEKSPEAKKYRSDYPGVFGGTKKPAAASKKENLQQMDDRLKNDTLFGQFYEKESYHDGDDQGEKASLEVESPKSRVNFIFNTDNETDGKDDAVHIEEKPQSVQDARK